MTKDRWAASPDDGLAREYPDWRDALQPAAEALFSLNRYAKWPSCPRGERDEIYGLKTHLVRLLYERGLAREVKVQTDPGKGKVCFGCDGAGWDADYDGHSWPCCRCDGTGWYRPPTPRRYVAIRFEVGGRPYAWHQPEDRVDWPYAVTAQEGAWEPEADPKPINLPPQELSRGKELIRWVLARAAESCEGSAA
jgi:hypothetical protein